MSQFDNCTDLELFSLVKSDSVEAFDELYSRYWEKLFNYTFHRVYSRDVAFEIVQEIFVSVWARRSAIEFQTSVSGYLFASVRFQLISYIRSSRKLSTYLKDYEAFLSSSVDNSNEEFINMQDLQESLQRSIEELPERCREITRLSLLQNWSTDRISSTLRISHRTVENQLARARKHLRSALGDYVFFLLVLCRVI